MEPKASCVIPTYNRIAWLAECVESLRSQTEDNIEIIVVDDCSTDSTQKLMEWFIKQDKRITYIRNEKNMGAGQSRNIGNAVAKAPIIFVCDSDDYYPADRISYTLRFFKNNKDVVMMNGGYYRVEYDNTITHKFDSRPFDPELFKAKGPIFFCHPSAAYRKEFILKYPYHSETKEKTDDYQLIEDFVENNLKVETVDKMLCFHRVLPGSIMTNMRGGSLE